MRSTESKSRSGGAYSRSTMAISARCHECSASFSRRWGSNETRVRRRTDLSLSASRRNARAFWSAIGRTLQRAGHNTEDRLFPFPGSTARIAVLVDLPLTHQHVAVQASPLLGSGFERDGVAINGAQALAGRPTDAEALPVRHLALLANREPLPLGVQAPGG